MSVDLEQPDLADTLAVSRQALLDEVLPILGDRPGYVVRMVCRMLEIAERELELLEPIADDETYAAADVSTEAELATRLREHDVDPSSPPVWAAIVGGVQQRLAVNRPGYSQLTGQLSRTGESGTDHHAEGF